MSPKNKKPAGGRPARNYDPRYAAGSSYQDRKRRPADGAGSGGSGAKAGSRSPGHRGYRANDGATDSRPGASREWVAREASEPKRRWSAQEKAGRDEARAIRSQARGDRGSYARQGDDRPARRYEGGDRPARRTDDRPARRYEGGDRPQRRFEDDRPQRRFEDRAPRRDDDRPSRRVDDRPQRRFDDRPARSGDDRPARRYDDRPQRRTDDRPQRRFDDRPARGFDDRPARRYDEDRPARRFDDRPARRTEDRPARRFDDRPARRFDDGPARRTDDRPVRSAHAEAQLDVVHERLQAEAVEAHEVENVGFGDLGLGENLVTRLEELGASTPFPIQAATIPPIIEGRDVLARGRTGSGKTIAFGAPLVEAILRAQAGQRRQQGRAPQALILAPTRELALQIDRTVQALARSVGLFTTQIYGGVPQARQVGALRKGVDIIVGTPGRIEDLVEQGKLDLSQVKIAVLDEADHMCELGFLEPVQRILRRTAEGSQKLLFSATLDREVAALVEEFLVEPAVYEVAGEDQDSSTIEHRVLVIDHRDKAEIVTALADRDGKTLVFARTRAYAEMLAEQLDDAGIPALALHGDLNQGKRTRNLERLTSGRVRVLVATDVAARGIHVDDIDLVVQADAPDEYKTYLHRSGRTGRAGRAGTVVTLVTRQRRRRMTELLSRAEIEAPFEDARPGDEVVEALAGRPTVADLTS
ncbi:superfamily II DNA/RNA helicase [Microbacterium sp. SLBN-154]|uniref:DEAD/DEAH box helicase n=1 Tax=Microbacterium sp. SLBN-154 TaxID=2768458 RepID=UPI0011528C01|nr:DEAD/DEAH box helicase [Microbacterium sp. SLBN-154]TQK17873.1 superfamily II DNA/RNA helicase [Microbacterium sp. SLBN-154]